MRDVGAVADRQGDLPAERTHILSTGGMVAAARPRTRARCWSRPRSGMLHQLRRATRRTTFLPMNSRRPAAT